jgi:hypothetical protein
MRGFKRPTMALQGCCQYNPLGALKEVQSARSTEGMLQPDSIRGVEETAIRGSKD